MFLNVSSWETFSAATDAIQDNDIGSPTAGLTEGLSGAAVGCIFLIGIVIAVRKNLEVVRGVLVQLLGILTAIANAIRKRLPTADPLPPPNHPGPRNYTDDQMIEMRRHMDDHVHDQEDYGASTSVWI